MTFRHLKHKLVKTPSVYADPETPKSPTEASWTGEIYTMRFHFSRAKIVVRLRGQELHLRHTAFHNELLNPLEERENLDIEAETFGDDTAVIAEVCQQEVVWNRDAIEVDSDDKDDPDDEAKPATTSKLVALVEKLEAEYLSCTGIA
ncbi:hypothetical protein HD554DRAFT_2040081 [Boletus coccyginus]|nr:hypothetical protein HD554DRAFT_2040081 [Boletus coccyginus]